MGIKKYYSTQKGKKVHVGWLAQLIIDGKCIEHHIVHDKQGKSQALYWLETQKKSIGKGTYASRKHTLNEVFELYFSSTRWNEIAVSSRTYYQRCYTNFLRIDEKWLNMAIGDLNVNGLHKLLQDLQNAIPRSRKHLAREIDFLSACMGHFRETVDHTFISPINKSHKYTFGKLARRSGKKMTNKIKKSLDFDQINALLKDLKESGSDHHSFEVIYYYITRIQLIYGFRLSEVCGLEWSDIDFNKKTLRLTGKIEWYGEGGEVLRNHKDNSLKEEGKLYNDEALEFPLYEEVEKVFREIQSLNRSRRWVMANRSGEVPQYSKIYKRLSKTGYFKEVGQCSHKIRKTTKTLGQVMAGAKDSRDLLRHASEEVSDRYRDETILARHNPIPKLLAEITAPK